MDFDAALLERFKTISTATLTTVLLKKGMRNIWIRGPQPITAGQPRVVGPAFTLRFVPMREDLATPAAWSAPISTRTAVEAMPAGCITVAGVEGCRDAGIYGDILCARMHQRGVAALITDGVIRDIEGIRSTMLPVWAQGTAAPPAINGLTFVNWQEPIGCGGVAVYPGDLIVADADGAVVVPRALADEVVEAAEEQERLESWILAEVIGGTELPGLYPPSEAHKARYEAAKREGKA